jgi:hypothetical protein
MFLDFRHGLLGDVALLSLEFPASERNQEHGATPKLLSRCAFANMCGRAGRLNQRGGEAVVYVWLVTDDESSATRLVEIFYCEEDAVRSKIVHGDDKDAFELLKKERRSSQAPLLFTYPLVKTVLDGLRFTGGAPGLNGATRRTDATLEELEDELSSGDKLNIRSSFRHLKSEFVFSAANQGADAICRAYWDLADEVIWKSTESGIPAPNWPEAGRDDVYVQAVTGLAEADAPRVRLREGDGVLEIVGHRLAWQDDTRIPLDAVKWQVQASYGSNQIRQVPGGFTTVVVDFPWLLRSVPSEVNVLRMSPAAFGILLTLVVRSFFKDSVTALELLSAESGAISSVDLMDRMHSELLLNQLPDALFDAWAGYWDAE